MFSFSKLVSEWTVISKMWFFFEMCFHFQNMKGFVSVVFPKNKKTQLYLKFWICFSCQESMIYHIGYTIMIYTVRAHFYVHVWKPYKSIRLVILTMYAVCTYVVCESLGCIFISHVQPLKKLLSLLLLCH